MLRESIPKKSKEKVTTPSNPYINILDEKKVDIGHDEDPNVVDNNVKELGARLIVPKAIIKVQPPFLRKLKKNDYDAKFKKKNSCQVLVACPTSLWWKPCWKCSLMQNTRRI